MTRAVVLGLSPTGLYSARELNDAGVRLLGIERETACGEFSNAFRNGDGVWRDAGGDLMSRLLDYAAAGAGPPLLVPTNDHYIEFVNRNAAELGTAFRFADCHRGSAEGLLDKARFHTLCVQHGIEAPGVWAVGDQESFDTALAQVRFPAILKPLFIHRAKAYLRGAKVIVVKSRDELATRFAGLPAASGKWLVQEVIPGPESRITVFAGYVDRAGVVRQSFSGRKLRQYPIGFGSASLAVSEQCAETTALSVGFLRAIGFSGMCGAEFKRDPRDGRLKIIEINPRPTLWFQLCRAAGKRVVEAAWRDLTGLPPLTEQPQKDGVVWRYGIKDFAARAAYHVRRGRLEFPPPDRLDRPITGRCWPVFDHRDPMPFVLETLLYPMKFIRRVR